MEEEKKPEGIHAVTTIKDLSTLIGQAIFASVIGLVGGCFVAASLFFALLLEAPFHSVVIVGLILWIWTGPS